MNITPQSSSISSAPPFDNILQIKPVLENGLETRKKDIFYKNYSRYIGLINEEFQRHGEGLFWTFNGVNIQGKFKQGKPDGLMTITYPNNMIYHGTLSEQFKLDGKGTLTLASKIIEVVFNNGILSNSVEITYKSGEYKSYIGTVLHFTDQHFSQSWQLHGHGKLTDREGITYEGNFKNNCMVGDLTVYYGYGPKFRMGKTRTLILDTEEE